MTGSDVLKPLFWVGSSRKDVKSFPDPMKETIGYGLYLAQAGGKHRNAKPLKGFHGAGVLEIVDDHDGDTYRAVYTVKFAGAVYVLHAFQKKSKKGIAAPKYVMELIEERFHQARQHYAEWR